jgi:alpha-ribazole phosphatase/probable phosphoglycerate mutase
MNRSSPATIVDLLRHGEPVGGRRYRGQTDDPLSDEGWRQMRAAVSAADHWDVIYSSPLKRCAAFAEELARQRAVPLRFDERLREIGFGAWEGQTPDELRARDPERLENFWRDPVGNRPEDAEPLDRFAARVSDAWRDLLASHPTRHILVVGHAGITRMVMSLVLGTPLENLFRIQVENAGLTRIRVHGQGADAWPVLVFHGRTPSGA